MASTLTPEQSHAAQALREQMKRIAKRESVLCVIEQIHLDAERVREWSVPAADALMAQIPPDVLTWYYEARKSGHWTRLWTNLGDVVKD